MLQSPQHSFYPLLLRQIQTTHWYGFCCLRYFVNDIFLIFCVEQNWSKWRKYLNYSLAMGVTVAAFTKCVKVRSVFQFICCLRGSTPWLTI